MTFAEMVRAVNTVANGYPTLGVKVGPAEIASALSRAQRYVAGDLATYAHRREDPLEVDPYATEFTIPAVAEIPSDTLMDDVILSALDPATDFLVDGSIEPSLPSYAHDAIVTRAALFLLNPANPQALQSQYEKDIVHARRSFLLTKPNRPVQVQDRYDPYRFLRTEW